MTDAELVNRARDGDRAAFDLIVERYQHVVFRATLAVTASREDAEDAAQETFIRAFGHLRRFRGESSLKTWLLAIAWREGLSRRRSVAARLKRFVAPPDEVPFDPPAPGRTQEMQVVDLEYARAVGRLIAALPVKLRTTLLLASGGDHTFDEMAEALGVPAGTLKWRVSEARRQLRTRLQALGYGSE